MRFLGLVLLLFIVQPFFPSLSPAQQAAAPDQQQKEQQQQQKQDKKAQPADKPGPLQDVTQPPVKPDAAKSEQRQGDKNQPTQARPGVDVTAPPIELDQIKPTVYTLNPAKASKAVEVGNFYMKKGNWSAAASRFEEALKWNPKSSEAYLRLAEAREKKGELAMSLDAYQQYLKLDPDSKKKKDVEKAMAKLQAELSH